MASGTTTTPALVSSTADRVENVNAKFEYNQRLAGYLSITMCSGINFISISIVNGEYQDHFERGMSVAFGVLTFSIASLVLLQDRSQQLLKFFHYTKARNGYIEGAVLIFMVFWWIIGVGVITKPGGLAYQASNIYYSSWGSLFSCIYTLDLWSTEKDILSIAEITGVSCTLKSWWIHFLSAFVVFACSINLHVSIDSDGPETLFAVVLGFVSIAVSTFWIGVHLNFFSMCGIREGGWFELFCTFFLMFLWVVGVGVFTTDGGIAAKMEGDECRGGLSSYENEQNCTIILLVEDSEGVMHDYKVTCNQFSGQIPGSNLYYSSWSCMLSSIAVAFEWKASQVLKFAKAQAERQQQSRRDTGESYIGNDKEDVCSI